MRTALGAGPSNTSSRGGELFHLGIDGVGDCSGRLAVDWTVVEAYAGLFKACRRIVGASGYKCIADIAIATFFELKLEECFITGFPFWSNTDVGS